MQDYTAKSVGENIAALRKSRGLTQEQLAEICEMSTSGLQKIEQGQREPSAKAISLLAKGLKVETWDIVPYHNGDIATNFGEYLPKLKEMLGINSEENEKLKEELKTLTSELLDLQKSFIHLQKENQQLREIAYGKANAGDAYTEHMDAIEASDPQNPGAGQLEKVLEALKTAHPSHIDSIAAILDVRESSSATKSKKNEAG